LGNKVSTLALVGIVMILVGLVLVFRQAKASSY
jgi:hypothetical protein